ncbi:hypothetical protein MTR67_011278 [Solanum verrucosum]|uniref:Uncharacterized protein n=1 Tax=Solanum verrucosum TaxID=315347 RepID=A0AAF0Q7N9_SOLVR|nr:hypothetical protein MTR67_011278 [Solanum verrucosum]
MTGKLIQSLSSSECWRNLKGLVKKETDLGESWIAKVETVSHLFLQCRTTTQLWRIFVSLRGISWVMPNKITHLLYSWEEAGVEAADKDRWRIVPACICWTI